MTKAEARKYFRKQRMLQTEETYQIANQRLYARTVAFLKERKPLSVHSFLPILKNKEVNTWPIIAWLHQQGIKVVVPKSSLLDNRMQHYQFIEGMTCTENSWGIPEPQAESLVSVREKEINVVLVPLLAVDEQGHRVGYGKGYYDVFLSKCKQEVLKVGLSLFPPIPAISDVNHLDIRLTHAITPDRIWSFKDSKA